MIIDKKVIFLAVFVAIFSIASSNLVITLTNFNKEIYKLASAFFTNQKSFSLGPLSSHIALAILSLGSKAPTTGDINAALKLTPTYLFTTPTYANSLRALRNIPNVNGVECRLESALFLDEKLPSVKSSYESRILNLFRAPIIRVPFETDDDKAATTINDWSATQTGYNINELINSVEIVQDTVRVVAASVFYLNSAWKSAFTSEPSGIFINANSNPDPNHPFAQQVGSFRYKDFSQPPFSYGFEAVELPYANDELSMVLLIPIAGFTYMDIENKIKTWTNLRNQLFNHIKNAPITQVDLTIPQFTVDTNLNYNKDLGLKIDNLWSNPNLNGIFNVPNSAPPVSVGVRVVTKAVVNVYASGTLATGPKPPPTISHRTSHMPTATIDIKSPFVFLIKNKAGELLVFGRYTGI